MSHVCEMIAVVCRLCVMCQALRATRVASNGFMWVTYVHFSYSYTLECQEIIIAMFIDDSFAEGVLDICKVILLLHGSLACLIFNVRLLYDWESGVFIRLPVGVSFIAPQSCVQTPSLEAWSATLSVRHHPSVLLAAHTAHEKTIGKGEIHIVAADLPSHVELLNKTAERMLYASMPALSSSTSAIVRSNHRDDAGWMRTRA